MCVVFHLVLVGLALCLSTPSNPSNMNIDTNANYASLQERDRLERFINDVLRRDLKEYETYISRRNGEVMEYVQLKNVCESIADNFVGSDLKTQVNIGGNMFISAKVKDTEKILVNVGLDHYVEFTLPEAVKFCDFKVRVLQNEIDVIREKSIETRANIKLALLCIAERDKLLHTE